MKVSGAKVDTQTWMLAAAADCLSVLVWQNTENGAKGKNKPTLFTDIILGMDKHKKDIAVFDTPDEFDKALQRIKGGDD